LSRVFLFLKLNFKADSPKMFRPQFAISNELPFFQISFRWFNPICSPIKFIQIKDFDVQNFTQCLAKFDFPAPAEPMIRIGFMFWNTPV
jgi:hypothetical protein